MLGLRPIAWIKLVITNLARDATNQGEPLRVDEEERYSHGWRRNEKPKRGRAKGTLTRQEL
jgi:hypothetical protein